MNGSIQVFATAGELAAAFAKRISEDISKTPAGQYYSIALSGGSTPRTIFTYIAENYNDKINWANVLVFWGDERCVPPTSDDSNFKMAKESLLQHIKIPEENIFRIRGENDPDPEAKRYAGKVDKLLHHWNNIPQFDLFMLGLGEDGHTASIFPDSLALLHSEKLFEVNMHPVSKQKRITATGKLINNSKQVFFIVTGESKATKVVQIIERKEGWQLLPASFIRPAGGELIWWLDDAAGQKLSSRILL